MFPSRSLPRHGIFLQRQAQLLAKQGIQTTFLVPRPWTPWPLTSFSRWRNYGPENPLLDSNFPYHEQRYLRVPGLWYRRYEGMAMARSLVNTVQRLHQQTPFDAILACPMIPDAVACFALKQCLSIPLITMAIGSDVLVYPNQMPVLEKQLQTTLQQTDLAVGVSQDVCSRLEKLGARSPLCVYLGRTQDLFTPPHDRASIRDELDLPKDAMIGVYVGNLVDTKGIRELSLALEGLLKTFDHLHFVCVGDGAAGQRLESVTPSDRIHLIGETVPEQVPAYLQAADFLVFPSYSEGMPQVVLEAMACGLPIVATSVGGIPEAVINGDNGILVEPRHVEQLSQAITWMITDQDFRERARQRSLEIVQDQFDSEINAQRLADAIHGLVRTTVMV